MAIAIAVLYRYWLVTPVLEYLSIHEWFLLGVAVAVAIGCVMSLLRFSTLAQISASVIGLLLGGTWAGRQTPSDVAKSVSCAFESHLEVFWRPMLVLILAIAVGQFWCTRFLRTRTPTD
jgi:hypothetical protein